ncbi:MAG: helix-turn-helix transcriptional regulator [Bacilli bacterium]|nr:helix-turn-helix transcriptional regulator [Bacilli bacterium]
MSLADKIIKIRLDNNLSKEEFANELFVTVMDVEKWEQGYSVPDEGMLNVIAFKFNVPFDYLLEKK